MMGRNVTRRGATKQGTPLVACDSNGGRGLAIGYLSNLVTLGGVMSLTTQPPAERQRDTLRVDR